MIEIAIKLADHDELEPVDLVIDRDDPLTVVVNEILTLREYDMKIIRSTLKKNNNDIKLTADILDIGSSTIYRMLKEEKE